MQTLQEFPDDKVDVTKSSFFALRPLVLKPDNTCVTQGFPKTDLETSF